MDVVVIGAGPVGLAQACLLKALNKSANICILDKRRTISRDYGIAIGRDAVKTINTTLDRALKSSDFRGDQLFAGELKHIFSVSVKDSQVEEN